MQTFTQNPARTLTLIDEQAIRALQAGFHGTLVQPGDADYDEVRAVYNAMIDRYPALIARCVDATDVVRAVNFARDHKVKFAVRGGGHHGGGLGTIDDGLVIDLSLMRKVEVDPATRTAWVQGGALLSDVDQATHVHGLAMPSGINSTTGIGGLTLGGGLGHLTRSLGLTIDNLLAAKVVLADGSYVLTSASELPDLFWAIRGGGGNFGVVTDFQFKLHPISNVTLGMTFWAMKDAKIAMQWYRDFLPAQPDGVNGFFTFFVVPPSPPFAEELYNQTVCGVFWCHTGTPEQVEALMAQVRQVAPLVYEFVAPLPYPVLQNMFDAVYPKGQQWYWKADFIKEIPDAAIEQHIHFASQLPTAQSTMHLYPIDGAAGRVGPNDTAWAYRDAKWCMVIIAVDPDPAKKEQMIEWGRAYWQAIHPYSAGGAYVNMMMDNEGQGRVRAAYRHNYEQLAQIKRKYDPANLFHNNQNILPAPANSGTAR